MQLTIARTMPAAVSPPDVELPDENGWALIRRLRMARRGEREQHAMIFIVDAVPDSSTPVISHCHCSNRLPFISRVPRSPFNWCTLDEPA